MYVYVCVYLPIGSLYLYIQYKCLLAQGCRSRTGDAAVTKMGMRVTGWCLLTHCFSQSPVQCTIYSLNFFSKDIISQVFMTNLKRKKIGDFSS